MAVASNCLFHSKHWTHAAMQGWVNAQHCLLMYRYRNCHVNKLFQTAWALAVKTDVMRHSRMAPHRSHGRIHTATHNGEPMVLYVVYKGAGTKACPTLLTSIRAIHPS